MAREVTHDEQGPYVVGEDELDEQGGTVAFCQCGLSATEKPVQLQNTTRLIYEPECKSTSDYVCLNKTCRQRPTRRPVR